MFDRLVRIKRTNYYTFETAIAIAVLIAINKIYAAKYPSFLGIDPNPYWLVVLAMAARYGRKGAIFSGILTAIAFCVGLFISGGFDVFYDDMWVLRYPLLFMLVGFMIGEIRTVFILREDYLTKRVQELQNLNDQLRHENDIIKEAHRSLSVDMATQRSAITVLNDITGRLKSMDPDEVYLGILKSFVENLNVEECSFYEKLGDELVLKHSLGWKEYYNRPKSYKLGSGYVGIAAVEKKILSIKDEVMGRHEPGEVESDMVADSLIAVPVVGLEERVFGVASIEKMPFLKLTELSIETVRVIAELAASSLNNSYAFKGIMERQIHDEEIGTFRYHYFLSRLKEEFLRSVTYMIPLSAISMNWSKIKEMDDEKKKTVLRSIAKIVQSSLRPFDVLARGPIGDIPLVLLLSTTSGNQAKALSDKIVDYMKGYGFDKIVSEKPIGETLRITEFKPNSMAGPDDFLKEMDLE